MKPWSQYKGVVLGNICKRGHDHGGGSFRYTCSRNCVQCLVEHAQRPAAKAARVRSAVAWNKNNPSKHHAHQRRWKLANRPKVRADHRRRQAAKQTPMWADLSAIREKYEEAARLTASTGIIYEVDHVVPLRSALVCGLHVEGNLEPVPRSVNRRKGNKFEVLSC